MGDMSDLEVQKRLWGRDGHGIPGANPHFAGRAGIIGSVVVTVVLFVGFVTLTDHTPKVPGWRDYDQFSNDVAKGDLLQTQLPQSLQNSPAASSTIVLDLVRTLHSEDRRLLTKHWPIRVERDMERFVTLNEQQIAVLNMYSSASASERNSFLTKQVTVAGRALSYDAAIHDSLDPRPGRE
jgi:hypothetical protein